MGNGYQLVDQKDAIVQDAITPVLFQWIDQSQKAFESLRRDYHHDSNQSKINFWEIFNNQKFTKEISAKKSPKHNQSAKTHAIRLLINRHIEQLAVAKLWLQNALND